MEERKMKTRKLLISIMLLSAVSMLHAANTEEYWGTWVNREYDAYPSKPAMFILTPDGKFAEYGKESDAGPLFTGTITIKKNGPTPREISGIRLPSPLTFLLLQFTV
jgi:hypothetical protein